MEACPVLPMMQYQYIAAVVKTDVPLLQVVVDTEEEFDWFAPPSRESNQVTHMAFLQRFHQLFVEQGITPCYVVDYPIATTPSSVAILKGWLAKGECEIGAHLHPWVTPPFDDSLSYQNMYPGNLPRDLEKAKLTSLKQAIEDNLGVTPTIYKAGRYGYGPNTSEILQELGFTVDASFSPGFDMTEDGGPDHVNAPLGPFHIDRPSSALALPTTGAIVGRYPGLFAVGQRYERFRLPGILSRLGLADRLRLTPEGFTHAEHVKLTEALLKNNVNVFSLTFHSSSSMPGGSPYSTTQTDIDILFNRCQQYCDYFFKKVKGKPTSPLKVLSLISW